MNLVDYNAAAKILGFKGNSGYALLAEELTTHLVNGVKHWDREQVEGLAKERAEIRKIAPPNKVADSALSRIEAKLDRLLAELGVKL